MNRKATWNQIKNEHSTSLYELYHENSKGNLFWKNRTPEQADYLIEPEKHNALPLPFILEKTLPNIELKYKKEERREEVNSDNMLDYLGLLLQVMYGYSSSQKENSLKRVVLSENDIFPLEIYFYADDIVGIKNGIWHYNMDRRTISLLKYCNISVIESHIKFVNTNGPKIILFITSLMNLSKALQGERAYRNALIETGKVLQNAYLFSQEMNVSYSEMSYFNEYEIEKILDIDGINHMLLSGCLLGRRKSK